MSLPEISSPKVFLCDGQEFVMNWARSRWQKRRTKGHGECNAMHVTKMIILCFILTPFQVLFIEFSLEVYIVVTCAGFKVLTNPSAKDINLSKI